MSDDIREEGFFAPHKQYFIQQVKEWGEIITGFETRNKYKILGADGREIGYMAEQGKGLGASLKRMFLKTHRPMTVIVYTVERQELMRLERPFFWFFSTLSIFSSKGELLGVVKKRFSFFNKKYDLCSKSGEVFAKISSPFWKIWTFKAIDKNEREVGIITKKWGGLLKEMMTDADRFMVETTFDDWRKKAILFATAVSIDMDYFDENQRND